MTKIIILLFLLYFYIFFTKNVIKKFKFHLQNIIKNTNVIYLIYKLFVLFKNAYSLY